MGRRKWWQGVPRELGEVTCGGARHRLVWERGRLRLLDHDLAEERALIALGGDAPLCVELFDAWSRINEAGGPRGGWTVIPGIRPQAGEDLTELRQRWKRLIPQLRIGGLDGPEAARLIQATWSAIVLDTWLPPPLAKVCLRCLEVQANRRSAAQTRQRYRRPEMLLRRRVMPALKESLHAGRGDMRRYAEPVVECWKLPPREAGWVRGSINSTGGAVAVSLPLSWLNRVWRRGIAVVEGAFVIDVLGEEPLTSPLSVRAVRWERQDGGPSIPVTREAMVTVDQGRAPRLYWMD